jgi:PD-(D/E)XK nuclease superfamily
MPKSTAKSVPINGLNTRTISEGFTQSEISDMGCMQRWNYRYNQLLEKQGTINFPLRVGTVWHDAQEQFYATKGTRISVATLQLESHDIPSQVDLEKIRYWNAVLPMMMEAYSIYYKADPIKWTIHEIEREMDIRYRGIRLRGKIDIIGTNANGNWIWDHKTTSRLNLDVVAGWDFRFQFMFYLWLLSKTESLKMKGFVINATKKPELRVKKTESLPEFAVRVREDMIQEPDKYFFRYEYIITKGQLERFEKEVVDPKLDILEYLMAHPNDKLAWSLMHNKNTDECQKWGGQPCQFLELCQHGESHRFLYREKDQKHAELEMEAE